MKTTIGMLLFFAGIILGWIANLICLVFFFGGIYVLFFKSILIGLAMIGSVWVINIIGVFLTALLVIMSERVMA